MINRQLSIVNKKGMDVSEARKKDLSYAFPIKKGPKDLMGEVLEQNLCSVCGACVGICPYIKVRRERVVMIDYCGLDEGMCYNLCPGTNTDLRSLDKKVFGSERDDGILGNHQLVVMSRAVDDEIHKSGQYGGTVTALITYVMTRGEVECSILTDGSYELPRPLLISDAASARVCSKSRYSACPTLSILPQALLDGYKKIGIVGRPCQVTAMRKRQSFDPELKGERLPLIIGLFCMWALSYKSFREYLEGKINFSRVTKMDIPQDGFVVSCEGETFRFPFEDIKGMRLQSCDVCDDFTAELADVSVGATEFDNDWNTLIARTDRGMRIIEGAIRDNVIKVKDFPLGKIELLREAAAGKKRKAQRAKGMGQSAES